VGTCPDVRPKPRDAVRDITRAHHQSRRDHVKTRTPGPGGRQDARSRQGRPSGPPPRRFAPLLPTGARAPVPPGAAQSTVQGAQFTVQCPETPRLSGDSWDSGAPRGKALPCLCAPIPREAAPGRCRGRVPTSRRCSASCLATAPVPLLAQFSLPAWPEEAVSRGLRCTHTVARSAEGDWMSSQIRVTRSILRSREVRKLLSDCSQLSQIHPMAVTE
jgi:hypothetical protein